MTGAGALRLLPLLALLLGGCGNDPGREPTAAMPSESPYPWSDCTALRPGDTLDAQSFNCPDGQVKVDMLNCANNETYIHLVRPGQDDLEGMMGVTTWLKAEAVPAGDYRTRWAREHCHEVD
ncbi:MAG: hypothetical protein QOI82_2292 [Actinomycetota bacterium]|jgi:hypothetical protein|nr:hypothetical protein [Actinomycetota bacterium]